MNGAFHTPEYPERKPERAFELGRSVSTRWRAASLTLAALLAATPALAYVLPQGSVLRRMVTARDDQQLVSLRVDGSLTLSGGSLRQVGGTLGLPMDRPEAQTDATFSMKLPGRCRLEAGPSGGQAIAAIASGGRHKSTGLELTPLSRAVAEVCELLARRASSEAEGRAALETHLRALGVEARNSSLARFGGRVVYVLGARREGSAQLWVYKDSFQPARLRWKDKDGTSWDVWMIDYSSPATGEAFPRVLEVYQNNERQLRFSALRGDTRARLDDALFAVQ